MSIYCRLFKIDLNDSCPTVTLNEFIEPEWRLFLTAVSGVEM